MDGDFKLQTTRIPYLFTRGRVFYFRAMLPIRAGGTRRGGVCISLRTTDLRTAKIRLHQLERTMSDLLQHDIQLANPEVLSVLKRIAREWFADSVADDNVWLSVLDNAELSRTLADTEAFMKAQQEKLHRRTPMDDQRRAYIRGLILSKMAGTDREIENHLDRLLTQAYVESARIHLAKGRGDFAEAKITDMARYGRGGGWFVGVATSS